MLDQKFEDAEMIIVDDASSDNPFHVLKPYISKTVKYIRLNKNGGYSRAKNIGIKESRGDVLVMLDADDMLMPGSLDARYKKLEEGYDFVHGPVYDFLSGGKRRKNRMWDHWMKTKKWKYIHAQSTMLRKQIHREIGLYDETMWCKSDREMFARIYHHGYKIGWVDNYVSLYRRHPKQMHKSSAKIKNNIRLQAELKQKINERKKDLSGLSFLE